MALEIDIKKEQEKAQAQIDAQGLRVLVCSGTGCVANGSLEVIKRFRELSVEVGELTKEVKMTTIPTGCHGFCEKGVLVIIPSLHVTYTKVKPSDVDEIVESHIKNGKPVERLLYVDPKTQQAVAKNDDIQFYARVKPEQIMRIVEALKTKDNIVAMTGDGVNDAPALKKASIGVAMGDGTDVAKEASDMILQNNDFTTIVKAIEGGRKIHDNIKRFVKYQVSTNVGAIITIVGTTLLNLPLPFNPAQLLWLNIVMDGPPAQMLGIEGAEKDIMQRPPEKGDILTKDILIQIFVLGMVMAIGTICVFSYYIYSGMETKKAMTIAFTLFVVYQLLNAFNGRVNSEKSSKYLYLGIIISFILQLLILYIPQLQMIFRTTYIGLSDWIVILLVASTILITQKIMEKVIQ